MQQWIMLFMGVFLAPALIPLYIFFVVAAAVAYRFTQGLAYMNGKELVMKDREEENESY